MTQHEHFEVDEVATRRGLQIPIIGFGTWQITGEAANEAVSTALAFGYRHIDTAAVYHNERDIGRALAQSGLDRAELFITTKLPGNAQNVRATIEQSLSQLGTDYVDLWLLHWPPAKSYDSTTNSSRTMYEEMLVLRDEGTARAIGVSNYSIEEVDELIAATDESPEVNQVPWSPFHYDGALQKEFDERSVRLEGYSPINTSRLRDPVLLEVAASHGVSAAQVILRWHVQHGVVSIPKSVHRGRIRENFDVFGFSLGIHAMQLLDDLSSH